MQLAITILGHTQTDLLNGILPQISECDCSILELNCSQVADANAGYFLVEGNWNQIARLERILDGLQVKLDIKIHTIRPSLLRDFEKHVAYTLETFSMEQDNLIQFIILFLQERKIIIDYMSGNCFQTPYVKSNVFTTKFIIFIPPGLRLLSLREEFLDFCDQLNIDAILEPIKR